MLQAKLAEMGVDDVDVRVTGVAFVNQNEQASLGISTANDATNGDITFFFIDPDVVTGFANYAQWRQLRLTFELSRGGETATYTPGRSVNIPWDEARVGELLEEKAADLAIGFASGDASNAVTGNLIIGLRTSLVNGNAMVVATSGGGKSMFVKLEILMLYLRFTKARFYVVDPENEYAPLVQELGGEVVNISVDSATHFNPLDFKYDKATKIPPHVAKAEFVLSLCEQIMGKEHILAGDKSLIDDALENIYKPLMESHYTAPCPTIKDLWMALNNQRDKRSKEIALALRIFATGSMQAFAQPTNVDMSNRLICFNIQSLGEQLKPVAMLSMLEYINTAVMSNERNDPKAATWVYFDEIYLLLRDSLSANFLYTSWKRFRKYNAYATGITQNVQDCLTNDTAYAMLANSEFVVMLRQTKDIDSVVELYGLSEPQRKYLLLAQPGEGIIKMGNSLIPFNNPQPKDTKTYKLLTTKPGEME